MPQDQISAWTREHTAVLGQTVLTAVALDTVDLKLMLPKAIVVSGSTNSGQISGGEDSVQGPKLSFQGQQWDTAELDSTFFCLVLVCLGNEFNIHCALLK